MFCTIKSACIHALSTISVTVEISATPGLPQEIIIGLPDTVVKESRSRIKSALLLSGFELPAMAYTINLAPSDVAKRSVSLELAMCVALLTITQHMPPTPNYCFMAGLSLDGSIEPVRQLLPLIHFYPNKADTIFIISKQNIADIAYLDGIQFKAIDHLSDCIELDTIPTDTVHFMPPEPIANSMYTYDHVMGHTLAKQACAYAVTGNHPLLFVGSPGIGNTMLMQQLPSLMPYLSNTQAIENCCISAIQTATPTYSVVPPYRTPHHTISFAGMIGGQNPPKPGEITLANHGILFLDELGEYQRSILETLREPMEAKCIHISRAGNSLSFPANFLLVAAMNPCPCGYSLDTRHMCQCPPTKRSTYWQRLSKPFLDRFTICMVLNKPKTTNNSSISHTELVDMVSCGRDMAQNRNPNGCLNHDLPANQLTEYCTFEPNALQLLEDTIQKDGLSFRARHRMITLCRTIADCVQAEHIVSKHVHMSLRLSQHGVLGG